MEKDFIKDPVPNEDPPIFKSWNQMYAFVLVFHVFIITILYILTKMYS